MMYDYTVIAEDRVAVRLDGKLRDIITIEELIILSVLRGGMSKLQEL